MEFDCCDLLLFRSGWETKQVLFWRDNMEEKHAFKWKLEAFVWLLVIPSERRYCFCRATQDWGRGISDLSRCVSLQLKLCWLIIRCRVSALILEICLLILIKNAVHLRGVTWLMRGYESARGTRSWRGKDQEQGKASLLLTVATNNVSCEDYQPAGAAQANKPCA